MGVQARATDRSIETLGLFPPTTQMKQPRSNDCRGVRRFLAHKQLAVALAVVTLACIVLSAVFTGFSNAGSVLKAHGVHSRSSVHQPFNISRSIWHPAVMRSAVKADRMLRSVKVRRESRAGRIFIPVLSNSGWWLCQMLRTFGANVAPYSNPSDIFVFSVGNSAKWDYWKHLADCKDIKKFGTLHFMAVDEFWTHPEGSAADSSLWNYQIHGAGYRLMGHWRLLFPFTLADMLGYKYVWQMDIDSEYWKPVNGSIIAWMQQHNLSMAYWWPYPDRVEVSWGLAELARAFLVSERYNPPGTLLTEHTDPPGLDGLYTTRYLNTTEYRSSGGGWDRVVLYGNSIVVNLDFWFQPIVQRFIELVTSSGYHYRFRWNEQGTIGMIWQLFVAPGQSKQLPIPRDGGYKHKGQVVAGCEWPDCDYTNVTMP